MTAQHRTTAGYVPPPCLHKQAEHRCGTHARYVLDRCRCDQCRQANTAYEKRRSLWNGEFAVLDHPYVDAEPVRVRVRELMAWGMGINRIGEVAQVAHGTLSKLLYGIPGRPPSRKVRRSTAEKLLGCPFDPAPGAKVVPASAARTVVAELLRRGWWHAEIARRVVAPEASSIQLRPRRQIVTVARMKALTSLLHETPPVPPAGRAGNGARGTINRHRGLLCAVCDRVLAGHNVGECRP